MKHAILTTIQRSSETPPDRPVLSAAALSEDGIWMFLRRHLWRYRAVELVVPSLRMGIPLKAMSAARLMTFGPVIAVDAEGRRRALGPGGTLAGLIRGLAARRDAPGLERAAERRVGALERTAVDRTPKGDRVLYLRCDLWFGIKAGGSVAHTAGVVNGLVEAGIPVDFFTPAAMPLIRADVPVRQLPPDERWWPRPLHHELAFNATVERRVCEALTDDGTGLRFLYHRNAVNCYAGAALAARLELPFVLEYNGSEVWVREHWGGEPSPPITRRIEDLNLRRADLVVVVSEPLREEALARGVPAERVATIPNGVDLARFHPDVDGDAVRRRHALGEAFVFGFIGTFGKWHGAEILAEAYCTMLERRPDLRARTRLLMVGDGAMAETVRRIRAAADAQDQIVLTGIVPQEDGPAHLAAADVLVSPHVPNPDGSAFFGSPTKLYEYMAMGKPIIASDLDQIGEVLADGRSARMTPPGDVAALSAALERAADNPGALASLGPQARRAAERHHGWDRHVATILAAAERLGF